MTCCKIFDADTKCKLYADDVKLYSEVDDHTCNFKCFESRPPDGGRAVEGRRPASARWKTAGQRARGGRLPASRCAVEGRVPAGAR